MSLNSIDLALFKSRLMVRRAFSQVMVLALPTDPISAVSTNPPALPSVRTTVDHQSSTLQTVATTSFESWTRQLFQPLLTADRSTSAVN